MIALELARAFHRGGHRVFVAETFPDYTVRFLNCVDGAFAVPAPRLDSEAFISTLASLIREHGVTHLLPTGEEALYVARGRARLDPLCRVLCDDVEKLDALHDKLRFQALAAAIGRTLQTWRVEDAAHAAALESEHGPLIFKRIYSRFGQSVATTPDEVTGSGWLAQQRAEGRELCGFAIARDGHVVTQVVYLPRYRLPRGPAFYFEPIAHARAEEWMRELVGRCRYSGPIAFDFIEDVYGTLYPLECNPRVTSGVHLMAAGDLVTAFLGESAPHPVPTAAMWGGGDGGHRPAARANAAAIARMGSRVCGRA